MAKSCKFLRQTMLLNLTTLEGDNSVMLLGNVYQLIPLKGRNKYVSCVKN